MFKIKNDEQRRQTEATIKYFEKKLRRIRRREGEEAAKLFSLAYSSFMRELRLQVKIYKLKKK